jgi:hypothetical protein
METSANAVIAIQNASTAFLRSQASLARIVKQKFSGALVV